MSEEQTNPGTTSTIREVAALHRSVQHLTDLVVANTDELMRLTAAIHALEESQKELAESLGGVREGMRHTNQRLRAVEGGAGADGGSEP